MESSYAKSSLVSDIERVVGPHTKRKTRKNLFLVLRFLQDDLGLGCALDLCGLVLQKFEGLFQLQILSSRFWS